MCFLIHLLPSQPADHANKLLRIVDFLFLINKTFFLTFKISEGFLEEVFEKSGCNGGLVAKQGVVEHILSSQSYC